MRQGRIVIVNIAAITAISLALTLAGRGGQAFEKSDQWRAAGQDLGNTRSQPAEHLISRSNVSALAPEWVFTTGASVSATPTVAGDAVYFPDWAGNLYAVNRYSGTLIWSRQISSYDGFAGAISRTSPAIYEDEIIIGDIESETAAHNGANIIAVDRNTGALRWITAVDSQPAAIITGSPVVYGGTVFEGISSNEETLATQSSYPCCTFRGSFVALDAKTGQMSWKLFDVPDNGGRPGGYSGGAVWQPPAIDARRGVLYVGTGNNYSVPASVEACQAQAIKNNTKNPNCTAADDYFDTAMALDLKSGRMRWANTVQMRWSEKLLEYDAWNDACLFGSSNCPSPRGPDYDLGGSGPNLIGNMVGFGEKSGVYWAFDADDGQVLWSTAVGPGGINGGIQWGTATDGQRIYVAIADSSRTSYALVPSGQKINWGSWSALDARTGNLLWQTADPTPGALDTGSVSVANGVLYADSLAGSGHNMYALDTDTGQILWAFASGGSVANGPSIVDGVVYWGSGYGRFGYTGNNKVYAFTVSQ